MAGPPARARPSIGRPRWYPPAPPPLVASTPVSRAARRGAGRGARRERVCVRARAYRGAVTGEAPGCRAGRSRGRRAARRTRRRPARACPGRPGPARPRRDPCGTARRDRRTSFQPCHSASARTSRLVVVTPDPRLKVHDKKQNKNHDKKTIIKHKTLAGCPLFCFIF